MPFDQYGQWYELDDKTKKSFMEQSKKAVQGNKIDYNLVNQRINENIANQPIQPPEKNGFQKTMDKLLQASSGVNEVIFGSNPLDDLYARKEKYGEEADRFSELGNPANLTTGDNIARGTGNALGFLMPYSKAYQVSNKALQGTKLLNSMNKLGKGAKYGEDALKGGLSGLQVGLATEGRDAFIGADNQTLGDRAKDVALETGLGFVGDPLIRGLGVLGKKGLQQSKPFISDTLSKLKSSNKSINESVKLSDPKSIESTNPLLDLKLKVREKPVSQENVAKIGEINKERETIIPQIKDINEGLKTIKNFHKEQLAIEKQSPLIDNVKRITNGKMLKVSGMEEIKGLPNYLKRQDGLPVDEVANELGYKYADEFIQDLKGALDNRVNQKDLNYQIQERIQSDPTYNELLQNKQSLENTLKTLKESKNQLKVSQKEIVYPSRSEKETTKFSPFVAENLKDISGFKAYTQDLYRNFRETFGDQLHKVKPILDNFDNSKKEYVDMQSNYLNRLKTEIVDGLGIKKGSKESALVQKFGEKKLTLDELKQQAPNKWQDIVKADEWFRREYDSLIDEVNAVRSQLYPNNPEKIVPKRADYYRHFTELNGFEGLKNLFDTPAGIDPSLVGQSEFTKPNSRFAGFMQRRGLGPYKNDAVGGFLNYIPAASYATKIDPQIKVFNNLKTQLADGTKDTKNINNFLQFLDDFSRDLAGKTNPADRFVQNLVGRTTFKAIDWMNRRVKTNVILGNVGSALSQLANIPTGVAFAKQHSIKGAGKTLQGILKDSVPASQSTFLRERFSGELYRQFDTRIIDQPKKFASWMLETADQIGTTFIWNSAYEKALAEGIKEPINYADNMARNLVAGRGIGEVPLLQKSKLFQVVAPFQLEVANLWKVQKDFVKEKDFGALATLFVANALFNKGMEEVRGHGVVFDPISAIYEASTEEDLTPLERGGRVAGEVLSNVPLGQTFASQYPEYGTNIYGLELPTREKLFGDNDPTRFGTGLAGVVTEGFKDPGLKLVLPFGGAQVEKTAKGLKGLYNDGVYKQNNLFTNDTSELQFPISKDPLNATKGLLFGSSGFKEAQNYYDNDRRPLTEKMTEEYKKSSNKDRYYEDTQEKRRINTIERRIKEVQKDEDLTKKQKEEKLQSLFKQLRELKK